MKIGIAGLPMSGKTTLFNMATRSNAQVRDYLSQSEEINTGVIKVPDSRLDYLTTIYKPKKTVFATVEFTDIPGVTKDEKGFSAKTLANIRNCDAILLVVRVFTGNEVPHVHDRIDPLSDLDELSLEFIFSDLQTVQNKIERNNKDLKGGKKPELLRELAFMDKLKNQLENNEWLSHLTFTPDEEAMLKGFSFLTLRPMVVAGNCSDDQIKNQDDPQVKSFLAGSSKLGLNALLISGKTEMEISVLSPEEEQAFLKEFGITESGRDRLIKEAYRALNYISFITVGEDEVRAWPIQKDTRAQKAAGKVHSDIERGFIRAEVVAYDDFTSNGGMAGARQAGLVRLEGKDYLMADGDIVQFRFNV